MDPTIEVQGLVPYLAPDAAIDCRTRECRNRYIDAAVRSADLLYGGWKSDLWRESAGIGLGGSLAAMLLGGTAALGPVSIAPYLGGAAAALAGGQAAFSKAALGDKAVLPLTMSMDAHREAVLVELIECEASTMEECPMLVALNLLEQYYQCGSIPGGLSDVALQATKVKARTKERRARALQKGVQR